MKKIKLNKETIKKLAFASEIDAQERKRVAGGSGTTTFGNSSSPKTTWDC